MHMKQQAVREMNRAQFFLFLFHIQSSTNTTAIEENMTEYGIGTKRCIPRYNPNATGIPIAILFPLLIL
jgi:hypothetical protein